MLEGKKSGALEIQLALKPWHADLAKHVVKRTAESLKDEHILSAFSKLILITTLVRGSLLLLQGKF